MNILVSVSGGETSWYMAKMMKERYKNDNLCFAFANTGREMDDTLLFNEKCSKLFGIKLHWVEAVVHYDQRKGCTHKIVDFDSASRSGVPFEDVIKKYGIPNVAFLHCTREMKANPLKSFSDEYFNGRDYYKAIGIRVDEFDRVSADKDKNKLMYPLVSPYPTRKTDINKFWSEQPFRLSIKSYEGNCDYCFKKTLRKLLTVCKEDGENRIEWWKEMEAKYSMFSANRKGVSPPYFFNRKNMSILELIELSKSDFQMSIDEKYNFGATYSDDFIGGLHADMSDGCEESCEPFH